MNRQSLLASVVPLLLPLTGCCTFWGFFCGPDLSRWVNVSFASSNDCLNTLKEAIRRDRTDVIYLCLAEDLKEREQIGWLEFEVWWAKLKKQTPGLHLAGTAEHSLVDAQKDGHATYRLEIFGRRILVDLVRQAYTTLRYEHHGEEVVLDEYVSDLSNYVHSTNADGKTDATATLAGEARRPIPNPAAIRGLSVGYVWKVTGIQSEQD
jgi:hypothetical protein